MVPSGSLGEISTAARSWGHQLRRKKVSEQVYSGMLVVSPGDIILYKMHPYFQGSSAHPGIFPVHALMCIYWTPAGKATRIHSCKKKKKRFTECTPHPPNPQPLPSPKEVWSLFQGKVRALLSFTYLVRVPMGFWELKNFISQSHLLNHGRQWLPELCAL